MIGAAADPGEYDPAALAEEAGPRHERLAAAIRRLPGGPGEAAAAELLEGRDRPRDCRSAPSIGHHGAEVP